MALHDDEMNKRREKREAQLRKRKQEAKRLRRTLFLAILLLAACAGGIWYLTKGSGEEETASAVIRETTVPTEAETEPTEANLITTVHLCAAGDLNVTDSIISAGVAVSGFDYSGVFKDVASLLSAGDLTVMNLEGNACGEPYGTLTTSAPNRLLEDLRRCGVDMLQVANSCSINNGINGLVTTLHNIRNAGIEPIGAFASQSEFQNSRGYTIAEVRGVKIAFVAFTKGLGGRGMPAGNERLVNLLYEDYNTTYQTIDRSFIDKILKDVEAEKPDITVALLHWGSEYNDDISKTQKSIVSLMQKRGVDIILGTHSHTLQPIEFNKLDGTLVAYSLGDFFGDASRGGTNYSIILDIEISKDTISGATKVEGFSYTPIYTVTETECPDEKRRVVRIKEALDANEWNYLDKVTDACRSSMEHALVRVEDRLKPPKSE